jgi:hypothetical protein
MSSLRLQPNDEELQLQQQQRQLEQDICRANYGKLLNVNSSKQVSLAIFGTIQSTTLKVLEQASKGEGVTYKRQQTLASLILQHKALTKRARKQRQQSTAFSTLASTEKNDDNNANIQGEHASNGTVDNNDSFIACKMTSSDSVVPSYTYGQTVDDLFDNKSKIHSFWKESLLLVMKPSARNMVLQLNSGLCPMGYDPTAAPTGTLKTMTEPTAGKKGSFLAYVRENKQRYPDCIILTRVGDFYETYGMDAVLLVEVGELCGVL